MAEAQKQETFCEEVRAGKRQEFIATTKWADAKFEPLAQDVSVRTFFRLEKDGKKAILMDARPPLEDVSMFEFMRNKFDKIGLHVPEVYNIDTKNGFVIMEDFGDTRCSHLVTEKKEDLNKLYSLFVDVLVHKFNADPKVALEGSVAYSDEYWLFRVEQFLLHYMPQVLKREVTEEQPEEFLNIFKELLAKSHKFDDVLLHGDYGVQNLYYFPEEQGVKSIGLIDFQDMTDARGNMMGSPAFDLVFLLQDVRVAIDPKLEELMLEKFIKDTNITDVEAFTSEYSVIGTAQAVKCLGLFARLGYVDGREEYLKFIPNCMRNLRQNLSHPDLKGIKDWFTKNKIEY